MPTRLERLDTHTELNCSVSTGGTVDPGRNEVCWDVSWDIVDVLCWTLDLSGFLDLLYAQMKKRRKSARDEILAAIGCEHRFPKNGPLTRAYDARRRSPSRT